MRPGRRTGGRLQVGRRLHPVLLVALLAPPLGGQERDVVQDIGRGVEAFTRDAWDVIAFPKDLDSGGWATLGGVLAVGSALYAFDRPIFDFFARHDEAAWRRGLHETGSFFEPLGLMGNTNRFWIAGIVVGYAGEWTPVQRVGQDLLVSHWLASVTRQAVRHVVGRARPEDGRGARHYELGVYTSFPSGHASTIMQLASVLSHHLDRQAVTVVAYALAGTVVVQRVTSGGHWPSDAWIGAAWGWGVSRVVLRNAQGRRTITPVVDPATGAVGVSIPVRW